jgi:ribosomal protein S6--L-glutamate ligase|tara:strand:+ start:234 stop:1616 length:1383 start_codon:yes stop_codon:yes gene_type:complete
MKAPKFKEFISEAKDNKKYKLLIITDEPEKAKTFHTANRLQEEAEKLGWKSYLYRLSGGYTSYEDGIFRLHNKEDEKGFEVSPIDTIAIIRGSVVRKDSWLDIVSSLEKHSICVVNSRQSINICTDKYRTSLRLADYGIKQPKTVLINDPEKSVLAFDKLDTNFPVIMKTLRGSKGVGVLFVESEKSLDSIVQLIYKQDEDTDLLLQEYIKTDYDVRVLVLGGKVLATMKRPVIEGDFRSNVSLGSKPEKIKLTEIEIEASLLAAKAVGGVWTAVDFIPSRNREKDAPFIIEVNSSPGTEGIEEASGQNISKEIIEFFAEKKNWVKVPSECGYKEVVTIKPFGEIIAKFDTGNSGMSVIHADNMKVIGKQIKWSLLGKTITSDIIRKEDIKVGGLRNYEEDRYVVKLDVDFLGGLYEVEFTLDDREDRTPILFDRAFMERINVMVNPARKYVVTTKYSLE